MHREDRDGSQRVLISAPTERDAVTAERILQDEGVQTHRCMNLHEICRQLPEGAGAALIAEEHLVHHEFGQLLQWLDQQPPWSDLPLIILLSPTSQPSPQVQHLDRRGNVTMLTRPIRVAAYTSAVQSSLRDRSRQYAVRDLLIERESANERLVANERRLSMALQSGGMAAWEWSPRQSIWSNALYDLLGLPKETPASPELFFQQVHPDDLPELRRAWKAAIEGREPYHQEFRIVRPDGEVRWLMGVGERVRDASGTDTQIYGLYWDITQQHLSASELRESEKRFRQLADAMPQMVFGTDAGGRLDYLNKRALEFFGRADFDEATLREALHPEDTDRARARWRSAVASGKAFQIEYRMRNDATGQYRWHLGRALPVRNESGEVIRWFGTCTDIHEQKLVQQKLNRALDAASAANVAKSEFLANMSHEIRTPMTAVLGYADLLAAQEQDPEKLEFLSTIKRNGSFLLEIINDILDLSKIEAGKMEVTRERFAPHEIIRDVWSMMQGRAAEKNLQFDVRFEGKLPRQIESDSKRLRQILVNLIGNAIKFTEEGSVRVAARYDASQRRVIFSVTDTGVGMSHQRQDQLFQPFTQGDASVSREFGGSGLGLAISQRLARMLGGEITATSEEGHGSTFSCAIDVGGVPVDEAVMIRPQLDDHPSAISSVAEDWQVRCRVLVVDDRRDVRFLVGHMLKKGGVDVHYAADGIEAVDTVQQSFIAGPRFDLILLDMQMPRLDGYEASAKLREMGYSKPIIALTADVMQGDMDRCIRNGCDAYLSKPINADDLMEMIERFAPSS